MIADSHLIRFVVCVAAWVASASIAGESASARTTAGPSMRDYDVAVHPSLPRFRFRVFRHDPATIDSIRVYRGGAYLQTLARGLAVEPAPEGIPELAADDIDFDGYADVRVLAAWGATGNKGYEWWLFQPGRGRFAYSRAASDVIGEYQLDRRRRTVTTHANGGRAGGVFHRSTFRFTAGRPVLVRDVDQEWLDSLSRYRRVTRVARAGRMQVESDTTFGEDDPWPDSP